MSATGKPRVAILGTRRSGMRALLALLDPSPAFGRSSDFWNTAAEKSLLHASLVRHDGVGDVHTSSALRDRLAGASLVVHCVDEHSAEFNDLLIQELGTAGFKCVLMLRKPDADSVFSSIVCSHYGLETRTAVAALRHRLMGGEPSPEFQPRWVRHRVRADLASHAWLSRVALAPSRPFLFGLDFHALFRDGIGALERLDAVYEHLRLGARAETLSDTTVLQAVFFGAHHAPSLRACAAPLQRLHTHIHDEIQFAASSSHIN